MSGRALVSAPSPLLTPPCRAFPSYQPSLGSALSHASAPSPDLDSLTSPVPQHSPPAQPCPQLGAAGEPSQPLLSVTSRPTALTAAPCPILQGPVSVYPGSSISSTSFVWGLSAGTLSPIPGCPAFWEGAGVQGWVFHTYPAGGLTPQGVGSLEEGEQDSLMPTSVPILILQLLTGHLTSPIHPSIHPTFDSWPVAPPMFPLCSLTGAF